MIYIPLTSNIITSGYIIVFEVMLPVLLAWIVYLFLSTENIKRLHEGRRTIHLRPILFPLMADQGLSETKTSYGVAILSFVSVVLILLGGFSINGVSSEVVTYKNVPVLVVSGSPNNYVDFTQHVSEDGNFVSGTYLLISEGRICTSSSNSSTLRFSSFNDIDDITAVRWNPSSDELDNSTCVTEEDGFEEKVVSNVTSFSLIDNVPDLPNCVLSIKRNTTSKLAQALIEVKGSCPFKPLEMWCSAYKRGFCVGHLEMAGLFGTFTVEFPLSPFTSKESLDNGGKAALQRTAVNERLESNALRSMAYLLSTVIVIPGIARDMVLLSVRQNATVGVIEVKEQTEIDEVLLGATTGLALCVIMVFGIITCIRWMRFVARPGRGDFNRFHSTADMLRYAATTSGLKDGVLRRNTEVAVRVLRDGQPRIISISQDSGILS